MDSNKPTDFLIKKSVYNRNNNDNQVNTYEYIDSLDDELTSNAGSNRLTKIIHQNTEGLDFFYKPNRNLVALHAEQRLNKPVLTKINANNFIDPVKKINKLNINKTVHTKMNINNNTIFMNDFKQKEKDKNKSKTKLKCSLYRVPIMVRKDSFEDVS